MYKENVIFSFEKKLIPDLFLWTFNALLATLEKVFRPCLIKFNNIPERLIFEQFLSKYFFCKCSSRQSIFGKPPKLFPIIVQVFLVKVQKWQKKNSWEILLQKIFPLYTWIFVLIPQTRYFLSNSENKNAQNPKKIRKF